MKTIKISSGMPGKRNLLLRQTLNSKGIWNDCNFVINEKIDKCDWWFVLHVSGLINPESCLCDPNHIVYVSMEPSEKMSEASNKFLEQFSCLVVCDRDVKHHNIIYRNWLTWWVGIVVNKKKKKHVFQSNIRLDYGNLSSMRPNIKINKISVILSDKDFTKGHKKRVDFINQITNLPISKFIDVYGHGYKEIPDKWDAIAPYKYHLVLENSVQKDYWSEKLADAFLGFSFPIYYGCPNIHDYFSKDSLRIIDINNISQTVAILQNIIDTNVYGGSMNVINISRGQVLNKYNIFNQMSELAVNNASRYQKIRLNTNTFYKDSLIKKVARFIFSKFTY
jgi:hypothetical protein